MDQDSLFEQFWCHGHVRVTFLIDILQKNWILGQSGVGGRTIKFVIFLGIKHVSGVNSDTLDWHAGTLFLQSKVLQMAKNDILTTNLAF